MKGGSDMHSVLENQTAVNLTDQVIAADLLNYAKAGVKSYASALTEAASPEVRSVLKKQLNEAISFQEQVSSFMMRKGWYNAYDINAQIQSDLQQSQNTISQIR